MALFEMFGLSFDLDPEELDLDVWCMMMKYLELDY